MKKVKITVLKTTLDEQLAREYGAEGLHIQSEPACHSNFVSVPPEHF